MTRNRKNPTRRCFSLFLLRLPVILIMLTVEISVIDIFNGIFVGQKTRIKNYFFIFLLLRNKPIQNVTRQTKHVQNAAS